MSFIPSKQIDIKAKIEFTEKGDFGAKTERIAGVILSILPQSKLDEMDDAFEQERGLRDELVKLLKDAKENPSKTKLVENKSAEVNKVSEQNLKALDDLIAQSTLGYAFQDENGNWVSIELTQDDLALLESRTDFKQQLRLAFLREQREAFRKN